MAYAGNTCREGKGMERMSRKMLMQESLQKNNPCVDIQLLKQKRA